MVAFLKISSSILNSKAITTAIGVVVAAIGVQYQSVEFDDHEFFVSVVISVGDAAKFKENVSAAIEIVGIRVDANRRSDVVVAQSIRWRNAAKIRFISNYRSARPNVDRQCPYIGGGNPSAVVNESDGRCAVV